MRAVVIDRYGGPEVLRQATVPRPTPTRGQVLVRTRFVGVNPKDVIVRKGKFQIATGKKFPLIVGHDIAGEVVEAGLGADLAEGDVVYGMINDFAGRGYAEYAAVDGGQLAKAPSSIELRVAAAVPLAAQTALQALRDDAQVKSAKILGAHVTAVCSHRNVDLVTQLGADRVIDYTNTELVDLEERFDAIFDVFGNYRFDKLEHLLTPRGTYVQTVPSARIFKDVARTFVRRKRAKLVIVKSRRAQLDWLRQQIDAGSLRVVVDRSFSLADAAEAHKYMETKRARGKVVLEIG
jgi:NADPH:quinone reductase-like Zn-dependent oxidoreductase